MFWRHQSRLFFCLGLTSLERLRSCHDGAFLKQWFTDQCAATQEYEDSDTGHNTPSRHSIQTPGPTWCCGIHWCGTSLWDKELLLLMSWVIPNREILPRPSTYTPANAQLHDAVMVVVIQKVHVRAERWTWDLWCANALHYPLTHGCFFTNKVPHLQFVEIFKHRAD